MKCTKCGYQLKSDDKICPECGQAVTQNGTGPLLESDKSEIPTTIFMPAQDMPDENAKDEIAVTEAAYIDEDDDFDDLKREWNFAPLIFGILIVILCISATGYAMYYSYNRTISGSAKDYQASVLETSEKINKVNRDFVSIFKDDNSFPADEIKKALPAANNAFNEISKNTAKNIQIPSSYSDSNAKLLEAIRLNRLMYQQLDTVLNAPTDPHIQQNLDLLSKTIDDCATNYAGVKIKGVNLSIPDIILSLPDKCSTYVKQKQTEYAQVTTYITSFTKYFDAMMKSFSKFDASKADFLQSVKSARNKSVTWESVLSDIDNSESIVREVKTSYLKQSVPSQLKNANKGFINILDTSLNYYSKLRAAVITEKSFNKEGLTESQITEKLKSFDKAYEDAGKINSGNMSNYQKYMSDMNSTREKFMNPEYVLNLMKTKK